MPAGLRSRDFRLTEADAARLREGGWRRRLAGLRSPRFAFMQPLGVAISTLALAGLLITGGGLPFLATTSAPVSAPAPAGTSASGGAAVREAPTERRDRHLRRQRVHDAGRLRGAGNRRACGRDARADRSVDHQRRPRGRRCAPGTRRVAAGRDDDRLRSPARESSKDQGTNAGRGPGTDRGPGARRSGEDQDATAPAPAPAATTAAAADPATSAGWLVLLVAGLVLRLHPPDRAPARAIASVRPRLSRGSGMSGIPAVGGGPRRSRTPKTRDSVHTPHATPPSRVGRTQPARNAAVAGMPETPPSSRWPAAAGRRPRSRG